MTTFHVGVSIDPMLRKSDKYLNGMLSMDGRSMSGPEVREYLKAERDKGYTMFCGCDNRGADGGCNGHEETSQ